MDASATFTRLARALAIALVLACNGTAAPESSRPPLAEKWFRRAAMEFHQANVAAANDSVQRALDIVPHDREVRLLAARAALARLEYDRVLSHTRGLQSTDAASLRGRAYWYKGDLERAADALETVLADPEVDDKWAKQIAKLARRGAGRRPFEVSGALLAQVDMPRLGPDIPSYVVPLEIDGDEALALLSTGTPEVVLDSATRHEPSWVSLRFAKRFEVRDVPALTQDLTGLSVQLGVPIKALLGVNLLRQLNTTLDRRGRQFVVRSFVPPPPPVASRVDIFYMRGGGMVMGGALGDAPATLYIDSSMSFPLSLDRDGWAKAGFDVDLLTPVNGSAGNGAAQLKGGSVPLLKFGAFKLPQIPAIYGTPLQSIEKELSIDLDGAVGAGLLADFRLTFADSGRVLWVEQPQSLVGVPRNVNLGSGLQDPAAPVGPSLIPGAPRGPQLPGGLGPALGPPPGLLPPPEAPLSPPGY